MLKDYITAILNDLSVSEEQKKQLLTLFYNIKKNDSLLEEFNQIEMTLRAVVIRPPATVKVLTSLVGEGLGRDPPDLE